METSFQEKHDQLIADKKRLEQQNQLKDKLLHMIGHDLRSPLGSIKMILDFVDQKIIDPLSPDFQSMLPEIADAADEAFYLLENLLYWTRIQTRRVSSQPEKYEVKQLIEKAITSLKRHFDKKKIRVISQLRGDYQILVDEYLFLVVFRNLLSNACKFSNENTEITIGLHQTSDDRLTLYIRDQGIGIKEENLQKIKDPYTLFSTYGTNSENGNGLGLKVADALIKIMGGRLVIDSEPEKGTTVSLLLLSGRNQQ